jgi:ferredoxin-fold anticodon binding domain-containing protein
MVQVDMRETPSVGIIIEVGDEYVLVAGARWKEKFHIDSVKHLAESEYRRDHGC